MDLIHFSPLSLSLICRGVSAISSPTNGSCIYTAGADGMICIIDSLSGNLLQKFRASTKAISRMSVSSGKYSLHICGTLALKWW